MCHLEWRDVVLDQDALDLAETSLAVTGLLGKMIDLGRQTAEDRERRMTRSKTLSEMLLQESSRLVSHPDLDLLPMMLVCGGGDWGGVAGLLRPRPTSRP